MVRLAAHQKIFDQEESAKLIEQIKKFAHKEKMINFSGKNLISKSLNYMSEKLAPASHLGWADSDRKIGNVRDY